VVSLQAAGPNPSTISVMAGTQLQFINADATDHQVVSGDCSELDSPTLAAGADFAATMGSGPKTCTFSCKLQPGATAFQGTVIVDQPFPGFGASDAGHGNPYGH
jgi:plastocyanin